MCEKTGLLGNRFEKKITDSDPTKTVRIQPDPDPDPQHWI